jgi:hypothetical protein
MVLARLRGLRDPEHLLRSLCRCDGLNDVAVVVALVIVAGALAVRLGAIQLVIASSP